MLAHDFATAECLKRISGSPGESTVIKRRYEGCTYGARITPLPGQRWQVQVEVAQEKCGTTRRRLLIGLSPSGGRPLLLSYVES